MRTILNVKHSTPADLAKNLRSLAAKIDPETLTSGADFSLGTTRVQVAEQQEAPIRAWARANADALREQGIIVGTRGRFSKQLIDLYEAHLRAERKAKRDAAKAKREAVTV